MKPGRPDQRYILYAAGNRARSKLHWWERRATPGYWQHSLPPTIRQLRAWDRIIAWKREWVELGKKLETEFLEGK